MQGVLGRARRGPESAGPLLLPPPVALAHCSSIGVHFQHAHAVRLLTTRAAPAGTRDGILFTRTRSASLPAPPWVHVSQAIRIGCECSVFPKNIHFHDHSARCWILQPRTHSTLRHTGRPSSKAVRNRCTILHALLCTPPTCHEHVSRIQGREGGPMLTLQSWRTRDRRAATLLVVAD